MHDAQVPLMHDAQASLNLINLLRLARPLRKTKPVDNTPTEGRPLPRRELRRINPPARNP